MIVEEIFSIIAAHMQEGLLVHKQLADIFSFLNLIGYQQCHEYHYFEESYNCRCLHNFYMEHYYKFIPIKEVNNPELIPSSWYKYTQFDVDVSTKRSTIRDMMKHWVDWEKSTKQLFQQMYKELYDIGEIAAASKIEEFLCDVTEELQDAEEKWLKLEAIGYDMGLIMDEQEALYKEYKDKR